MVNILQILKSKSIHSFVFATFLILEVFIVISSPRALIRTSLACAVADVFRFFLKHINAVESNFILFNSSSSTSTPILFLLGFSVWQFSYQYKLYRMFNLQVLKTFHGNFSEICAKGNGDTLQKYMKTIGILILFVIAYMAQWWPLIAFSIWSYFWRSTHWLGWGRWFVRHKITMPWVKLE